MGKLVLAYWDCPYCGNKGIVGSSASCPSCGRARGDVKFYMKDNAQDSTREENDRSDIEYVSEEKAAKINRNADWYCSFCNSLNNDDSKFCTTCGASRENSEANYFDVQKKLKEKEAAKAVPISAPAPAKKNNKLLLVLLLVVVAIVGFTMFMNGNKTGDWTVSSMAWERNIAIEQYTECSESDWSLPANATLVNKKQEIQSYVSVLDHYRSVEVQRSREVFDHSETYYTYEDKGNGYFEEIPHNRDVYRTEYYTETQQEPVYRQDPVYATKYYYTIWRWLESRSVTASAEDHNPKWPEFTLSDQEREGTHSESYSITVTQRVKEGKTPQVNTWYMKEEDWNNVNVNDGICITSTRAGANPCISDEKGNAIAPLYKNKPTN